jgi:hypothetical protein
MIRSAIRPPIPADWHVLGIDPADDIDAVRRAYRARLKQVSPERDPEGFQLLRESYEVLLASFESAPAASPANDASAIAGRFIDMLDAHRRAGDAAGAIALVDATLAAHPPGSAIQETIEDALLDQVALSRTLSSALFLHLAERFDWSDSQGRAARRDPEHHAVLLDRLAAEQWFNDLVSRAKLPGERVARLLRTPADVVTREIAAQPFDGEERDVVREQFETLRSHMPFVLLRFDGATLAAVRAAVEGEPLINTDAPAPAAPPIGPRIIFTARKRDWRVSAAVAALVVALVVGQQWFKASSVRPAPLDDSPSAEMALKILKDPNTAWLQLHQEPGGINVDWAPLINLRHGVSDVRFGADVPEPNTVMTLPKEKYPMSFMAPANLNYLTLRVRYLDGTWSEVRRYPIQKKD